MNETKERESLPELLNRVNPNELWINAAPDGFYALRILEAYRRHCDSRWQVSGLAPDRAALYAAMNQAQAQRATELDAAIDLLRRAHDAP